MIVLLSITALAATGMLTGILDLIRKDTGGRLTQEQELSIQSDIVSVGETMTVDGVSITLNEVYGDGTNFLFYLSFDGAKMKELEKFRFRTMDVVLEGERSHSESINMKTLDDGDLNDGHREVMLKVSRRNTTGIDEPKEIVVGTLNLVDILDRTNVDPVVLEEKGILEAAETVASGTWSFKFEIESSGCQEMSGINVALEGNAALNQVYMVTAEIESISLQMLGMEMIYWVDPEYGTLEFERPVVILADGSEIILREKFGGYVANPVNTGNRYATYTSEGPIKLDDVVEIRFGEKVIPWQPGN